MLLYNITTIVEDTIAAEWLQWMQEEHIPAIMNTGKFVSVRTLKVLDSPNEGKTYCVQFIAENIADYEAYLSDYASELRAQVFQIFNNKAVTYRTLMEFID